MTGRHRLDVHGRHTRGGYDPGRHIGRWAAVTIALNLAALATGPTLAAAGVFGHEPATFAPVTKARFVPAPTLPLPVATPPVAAMGAVTAESGHGDGRGGGGR